MRILKIELYEILDLINAVDTYGYKDDVLFTSFRDFMDRKLSDDEIEGYLKEYLKDPDYGEEDREEAREILQEFKQKYIK